MHDPDIQERVEREVRDVGRGREGWIAAVPEVEEDVAEGRGDQRGADEEPGRALGADESRARKTAERGEQLETFVQPGLVQPRPAGREVPDVGERESGQAGDENRLPEPGHRRGPQLGRSFHT